MADPYYSAAPPPPPGYKLLPDGTAVPDTGNGGATPTMGQGLASPPDPNNIPMPTSPLRVQAQQLQAQHQMGENAAQPVSLDEQKSRAALAALQLKEAQEKWDQAHPKPGALGTATGDDALVGMSPADQGIVKALATGRMAPPSSYSLKLPYWQTIMNKLYQYEPGTDMTTFAKRNAAYKSFMAGPDGRTMDRVNQAMQHLDTFMQAANAMGNSDSGLMARPLNVAHVAGMDWKNDPRLGSFQTARHAIAVELAAAFKGGNDPALASVEHWENMFTPSDSLDDIKAKVQTATQLLGGRIDAATYRFQNAVGSPAASAYDLMTPNARALFNKYSGNPDADAAPAPKVDPQAQLSADSKAVNIPAEYQAENKAFLADHPPGTLDPHDYAVFRNLMDQRFKDKTGGATTDESTLGAWVKAYNSGKASTSIPQKINVPLSSIGKARAAFSNSAFGTGLANAANAGSLGLASLALPQDAKDAFEVANAEHPIASTVGDMAGSIFGIGATERLGAKALGKFAETGPGANLIGELVKDPTTRAKLLGSIATNSAYGGIRGGAETDPNESVGENIVGGALGGAAGAFGGNLVTKGATPLLSSAKQDALKLLGPDIKLTTLQKLGLGGAEEAAGGVPGVHGERNATLVSFNRDNAQRAVNNVSNLQNAAIDTAIPKSVKPGTDMNAFVHNKLDEAYNAISPQIKGAVPTKFAESAIPAEAAPGTKAEINRILNSFTDENGHYDGPAFQATNRALRALQEDFATQAENGTIGARDQMQFVKQARQNVKDLVSQQNPALASDLGKIDTGWAHMMRIEDATRRAVANQGGVYGPGQYLTSIGKLDSSTNKSAFARGTARDQDYGQAAADILGSGGAKKMSLKESAITAAALGGAGYAAPGPVAGTVAALYAPGIKHLTKAVLTGARPGIIDNEAVRNMIADGLRRKLTGEH